MSWTVKDLKDCTKYGTLYHVKKVFPDFSMELKKIIYRDGRFKEVERPIVRLLPGLAEGVSPEKGDFVFRCEERDGKYAASLLKFSSGKTKGVKIYP